MAVVIGVDPGVSPNLSLVCSERGWLAYADESMTSVRKSKTKWRPEATLIAAVMAEWMVLEDAEIVAAEKIGPWTGQGLVSTSEFVGASKMIEGIAAGLRLRYHDMTPPQWKKTMGLIRQEKDMSRSLAVRLWPDRAPWLNRMKDHNRAEAALIAQAWLNRRTGEG